MTPIEDDLRLPLFGKQRQIFLIMQDEKKVKLNGWVI